MLKKLDLCSIKYDFVVHKMVELNGTVSIKIFFVNFLPQMKNKDKRTKLMNEIIGGVKVSASRLMLSLFNDISLSM